MKPSRAFVIACDRFGKVQEHSELFYYDVLRLIDSAALAQLKERHGELVVAKWEGQHFLLHQFVDWFGSGSFTKNVSHAGCDYQANWNAHGPSVGVLRLLINEKLHSASLLLTKHRDDGEEKADPGYFEATIDFRSMTGFEESYETFAKSECVRLMPLTRCPLVVSRYFSEEFNIASGSWWLIRMLSYAFFKTAGAVE